MLCSSGFLALVFGPSSVSPQHCLQDNGLEVAETPKRGAHLMAGTDPFNRTPSALPLIGRGSMASLYVVMGRRNMAPAGILISDSCFFIAPAPSPQGNISAEEDMVSGDHSTALSYLSPPSSQYWGLGCSWIQNSHIPPIHKRTTPHAECTPAAAGVICRPRELPL